MKSAKGFITVRAFAAKTRMFLCIAPLAAISLSPGTAKPGHPLCSGIAPKNNLWIGVDRDDTGISEAVFNQALDKVVAVYDPLVKAHGFTLQFNRLWEDGTVNSDTDVEGQSWVVNSYGGLARYVGMTSDAYIAVACHELGHHLGGAPLFAGDVMSVEGEADYHVGTKCLRKIFAHDDNAKIIQGVSIDPLVAKRCEATFASNPGQLALCERSAAAELVLAKVLQQLDGDPAVAFKTPDPSVVTVTNEDHPAAQCRLDTYFNSSVCEASSDKAFSQTDESVGACMHGLGVRPQCWYKEAKLD